MGHGGTSEQSPDAIADACRSNPVRREISMRPISLDRGCVESCVSREPLRGVDNPHSAARRPIAVDFLVSRRIVPHGWRN